MPWLDNKIKRLMKQRDQVKKKTAVITEYKAEWQVYHKLRNFLNRNKNKLYYENRTNDIRNDNKNDGIR